MKRVVVISTLALLACDAASGPKDVTAPDKLVWENGGGGGEGPPLAAALPRGSCIQWTDGAQTAEIVLRAVEWTHFMGPINAETAAAIRAVNPTAKLFVYAIPRYLQTWERGGWYWDQWSSYCATLGIDPDEAKLYNADGTLVMSNDTASSWAVANMQSHAYRNWVAYVFLTNRLAEIDGDGIHVDHPLRWSEISTDNPSFDQSAYDEKCVRFLQHLRWSTTKIVYPNFTTFFWLDNDPAGRGREAERICGGAYIQNGGQDFDTGKLAAGISYIIGDVPAFITETGL